MTLGNKHNKPGPLMKVRSTGFPKSGAVPCTHKVHFCVAADPLSGEQSRAGAATQARPGQRTSLLRVSKGLCPLFCYFSTHRPTGCCNCGGPREGQKEVNTQHFPQRACLQQEGKVDKPAEGMHPQCHTRGPWVEPWSQGDS